MIHIQKGNEPRELIQYRLNKSNGVPTYADMPSDVHQIVLKSLMEEQGFLCAYCMCRIPQDASKHNPPASIEHIDPQSKTDDAKALDYGNMLAVCSGNQNPANQELLRLGEKRLTCDAHRHNRPLAVSPLDSRTLATIRYKSDGTIFSTDSAVNTDLNDALNLNCDAILLPDSRKAARNSLLNEVQKHNADIQIFIRRTLDYLKTASHKPPYAGVLMDWLERHKK